MTDTRARKLLERASAYIAHNLWRLPAGNPVQVAGDALLVDIRAYLAEKPEPYGGWCTCPCHRKGEAMIHLILFLLAVKPPSYTPALKTPTLTCKEIIDGKEVYRSKRRRALFIRMTGGKSKHKGEVVNHIVPLACGGCDVPSNMEHMSVAEWQGRTGPERYDCGRHPGGEW